MIYFTVYGEPKAKGRPRFSKIGNYVRTYTDSQTYSYENLVKLEFHNSGCQSFIGDVALIMEIDMYMPIPKSVSKKKREEMINGKVLPKAKIDLDNGAKIIMDALNGLAYHDDKQIVDLRVRKFYSDSPRTEIRIRDEQ